MHKIYPLQMNIIKSHFHHAKADKSGLFIFIHAKEWSSVSFFKVIVTEITHEHTTET